MSLLALAFVETTVVDLVVETTVVALDPLVETTKALTLERSKVAIALSGLALRPPGFVHSITLAPICGGRRAPHLCMTAFPAEPFQFFISKDWLRTSRIAFREDRCRRPRVRNLRPGVGAASLRLQHLRRGRRSDATQCRAHSL